MCTNQITREPERRAIAHTTQTSCFCFSALVCVGAAQLRQSVSQSQSPLVSLHVDIRVQAVRKKHLLRLYLSKGRADRHHQEGVCARARANPPTTLSLSRSLCSCRPDHPALSVRPCNWIDCGKHNHSDCQQPLFHPLSLFSRVFVFLHLHVTQTPLTLCVSGKKSRAPLTLPFYFCAHSFSTQRALI